MICNTTTELSITTSRNGIIATVQCPYAHEIDLTQGDLMTVDDCYGRRMPVVPKSYLEVLKPSRLGTDQRLGLQTTGEPGQLVPNNCKSNFFKCLFSLSVPCHLCT